MPRIKKFYLKI